MQTRLPKKKIVVIEVPSRRCSSEISTPIYGQIIEYLKIDGPMVLIRNTNTTKNGIKRSMKAAMRRMGTSSASSFQLRLRISEDRTGVMAWKEAGPGPEQLVINELD